MASCRLLFLAACAALFLGVCVQDAQAWGSPAPPPAPSESECRPYIEKALKEMEHHETTGTEDESGASIESGEQAQGDQTDEASSKEESDDVVSTTEGIDGNSVEEADSKETQEASTEQSDDPTEEATGEADDGDATEERDSQEGDAADSKEEGTETEETEGGDSKEVEAESTEGESKENAEESEEDAAEGAVEEVAEEAVAAALEGEPTEAAGDGDGSQEEAVDTESEGGDFQEEAVDAEGGDSKEEGAEGGDSVEEAAADGDSAEGGDSKEESESGEAAEAADNVDDSKEVAEGDDSQEVTAEAGDSHEETSEAADSKEETSEAADSKEETADSKEDAAEAGDSQEEGRDSKETAEGGDSKEEIAESVDSQEETVADGESKEAVEGGDSKEEAAEEVDSKEEAAEGAESAEQAENKEDSKEEAADSKETTEDSTEDKPAEEEAVSAESVEQVEAEAQSKEESTEGDSGELPEEDLILPIEIPENLRPRDHISRILKLDESSAESEVVMEKVTDTTLRELKRLYDTAIKPLELLYKYRDLSNRHFGDPEIFSKPLILFMGPWSGGKSTIINYLLDNEYSQYSLRTGAEPSPAYFNILMHGERREILDGTQLAADWTFSGLQKFGQGLLDRLRGVRINSPLLEKVNIVEIPGILEIRKQVERMFPFNDACQWFIDRADIIFLVYDPSKLDVGPETEAILDQLKGREYQTRIILNKADQVKPEELMRVQGTLIWNISPLMSSAEPPIMYSTSLWSMPYENGAPIRLLQAQEHAFLRDLREAVVKRVDNKIASARRFAVRVRNHAKMVDCYLTTYYNHKTFFGNKKKTADDIIEHPQEYHIYEGLSTLTNISRYDLPDPETYRDFFKLNPLFEFQQLAATCTYFRGCPINRLDVAIAYDLPELIGKYKKGVEDAQAEYEKKQPKS